MLFTVNARIMIRLEKLREVSICARMKCMLEQRYQVINDNCHIYNIHGYNILIIYTVVLFEYGQ